LTSTRRLGTENSATRAALLDATEQVMLEDGYVAVSARSIAARAGLKPQLVHYYFRTMDDLLLAVFRRLAERRLAIQTDAFASGQPLRTIWDLNSDPSGTALNLEFVALANHRKSIRAEIVRTAEQFRQMQVEALTRALKEYGISESEFPASGIAMLMVAISRNLVLEETLGISGGHAEILAIVERFLEKFDGPPKAGKGPRQPTPPRS
jgi:AcrR family transcriptional regulator